jgi:hypothetical protein
MMRIRRSKRAHQPAYQPTMFKLSQLRSHADDSS